MGTISKKIFRRVKQESKMVTRFRIEKKKTIVCCILDIIDNCQSGYARETCINLTDFLIHRFDLFEYDVFIGKNEDDLLKAASLDGYRHAVIISAGTSLGLSDRLFSAIDSLCKEDFFVAGHILDRSDHSYYKNACFELHQQFYIVNLKDYTDIGSPTIGNEEWVEYQQVAPIRSEECLYNDPEIPAWIKKGTELKTYSVKLHGWNILNAGLDHNKILLTLPEQIRTSKKYLYYEYDHVFLKALTEIKYNHFFGMNFFAGWNSDNLRKDLPFDGPVEQYATVGIGFNWIKNLQLIGYTKDTRVIFTDINHNCLMLMKKMIETWDGKNYADFYWNNKPMLPNNSPYISESYKEQIAEQWEKFLTTVDNWDALWNEVKQLTYDYVLIDYTAAFNLDWLAEGKNTLLNLSDLYNHSPFIASTSLKYRIACENMLFQKIQKKDPNVTLMLTSRAADGFWKANTKQYLDKAGNFVYTDIKELKTPEWHIKDWQHNSGKPLGVE
jgi:hypothetical protein